MTQLPAARLNLLSLCMFSLFCSAVVQADNQFVAEDLEDFYGATDFVSIATGTTKRIDKAPAITTLITAEDIARSGATHLDEVLEQVPGLHVTPSTISRLDSVYSIRGIQTGFNPQVLVLLNGTEFKNSFSGGLPYTFRFPATIIERIEVIRGPGTAVYGADAYSGVINIVTKDLSKSKSAIGSRFGSFDSNDHWLHLGHQWQDWSVGLAIEQQKSDGDKDRIAATDQQSVFDRVFGTQASQAPGPLSTGYNILDVHGTVQNGNLKWEHWWWQQHKGGLGPGGAQSLDSTGYQNFRDYRTKLSYLYQLSPELSWTNDLSYLDARSETYFVLFPSGTRLPIGADGNINFAAPVGMVSFPDGYIGSPRGNHKDSRLNSIFHYTAFTGHQLRLELGWFEQKLTPRELKNFGPGILDGTQTVVTGELTDVTGTDYIYVTPVQRSNRHISLQDSWRFQSDWELTIGLRYDDFSDFGSTLNPRFALVWDTAHNLTTKLLYGSAFRAPSFNELFLQNNPAALGNPDLEPETIDTLELAFDYQLSFNNRLALNLYSYKAKDLIDKAPIPGTSFLQTANLQDLDGHGAEFEWTWRAGDQWKLDSNIAFHSTKNSLTEQQIALAPRWTGAIRAYYTFNDQWQGSVWGYWVADRARAATDTRKAISDYQLFNLSLSYQPAQSDWQFKGTLRNLFDKKAYEPSTGAVQNDYQLEGLSIALQASYHWEW
ncbi:MAG: TonB-dependent receptor [Gammaproteobacteria bacterium]|nr:TonB-dependent receptor [Gammaproteobacteria bacterium]MBU2056610.1 TonB-dependent receptor [Gammaproteobacteria bacterium]MBU2173947.1 TonB-dependent receptor [Gammaproteobacteria bacterium]MBU2247253.1 TonB-dependent receptor [Gammaproteobacteria bacterium]MBU2344911.1 TonB-dependent receptor [Gammaproteobacteria bacterium]